jgi:ubiquitin-conjugating enzyme E2 J1
MPTSPNGALGSLDYKKEERRVLAVKSREAAPRFGTPERQKLIDEVCRSLFFTCVFLLLLHFVLMSCLMAQIHQYMLGKAPSVPQQNSVQGSEEHPGNNEGEAQAQDAGVVAAAEELPNPAVGEIQEVGERVIEEVHEAPVNVNPSPTGTSVSREIPARDPSDQLLQRPVTRVQKPADDRLFTWAAVGLTIAIVVLLLKKFMKSSGYGALFMDGS